MKKILIPSLAFMLHVSASQATWQPYIGIGVGLSKSQNTFTGSLSNNIGSGSVNVNMDTTGTFEMLTLGIRNDQKNFFLAGELFTSLHQFTNKRKTNSIYRQFNPNTLVRFGILDFEVTQKYSDGISCMIGKDLTTSLDVFFKVDLFWSKFTIKYVNSGDPTKYGQGSKWLLGYAPGVGMQLNITKHISTRFDYSYRIYNQFRTKNISQETFPSAAVITGQISPRIHQFTLSLIYKF